MRFKFLLISKALFIVLLLISCSKGIYIVPKGDLETSITFYFFDSPNEVKPAKLDVMMLAVQTQNSDSNWVVIWKLSGTAEAKKIIYGEVPKGLVEEKKAEDLLKGQKYRIIVTGLSSIGVSGGGTAYFYFDEKGKCIWGRQ